MPFSRPFVALTQDAKIAKEETRRRGDTGTGEKGRREGETREKIDVALHLVCNVVFFSRPLATLTQDAKIAKKGHDS